MSLGTVKVAVKVLKAVTQICADSGFLGSYPEIASHPSESQLFLSNSPVTSDLLPNPSDYFPHQNMKV